MDLLDDYQIIRSHRKSIAAYFNSDGILVVKIPHRASNDIITKFIENHYVALWHLREKSKRKIYLSSDMFTGKNAQFNLIAHIKTCFEDVKIQAEAMGLTTNKSPIFKVLRSKWGYCRSDGLICLNIFLGFIPEYLIRSVIAHEFCHLSEMNHSKRFYTLLNKLDPMHKQASQELKNYIIYKEPKQPLRAND